MDVVLAVVSAVAATAFALDLARDLSRRFRPHTAAYAVGIGMFAIATWALAAGLAQGWTGVSYRVFFLFGAVLNIPYLALGSMFLVVGRRSGNVMTVLLGAFSAISITLVATVPFARPLPETGVPAEIFPPISEGFGPRLLAAIGSGTGATLLIALALWSAFRFWKQNPRIVTGNVLIVLGVLAASAGGTLLGFLGETEAFELSLLATVTLIWWGYRVTKGRRDQPAPLIVLVGPSTESPERAHALLMINGLESAGYRVMCPARDIESWGEVGYTPSEVMRRTFDAVEEAVAVVVDLAHGYGTVTAGYAKALDIPVIVAAPAGEAIPRPLRGVADVEAYYNSVDDVVKLIGELLRARESATSAPARRPVAGRR